jgi:hypothetical protein
MDDVIAQKMLANEKHQQSLAKINQDILVLASNAIRDKSLKCP